MTYQVVEVDLDRLDGAVTWSDGALVVGRRDGVPVAAALIDGAPPSSTSAIADRLTRRFGRPLPGPGAPVTVTVAICTRDRPERLARCLVSVVAAMEEAGVEVSAQMLVVDNASADGRTSDAGRAAGARVVVEPVAGLDAARNRALSECTTEVLAFVDDDVVVDRLWLQTVARTFAAHPDAGAVVGGVLAYTLDTGAQLEFERGGGFFLGWEARRLDDDSRRDYPFNASIGVGCNMAFRLEALERAGPFDEALDAPGMAGGGDLDILTRVALSSPVDYEPSAMVFHEHRRTGKELRSQYRSWGQTWAATLSKWYRLHPEHRPALRLAGVHAISGYATDLLFGRRHGGNRRADAAVMTAGFLSGLLGGYDRSRRRSEQRRREHVTATLPARTQKVHASGSARPSVSVILPFLNEERFLAGAVASVLAQTDAVWELLLVDDGSTDSSAATADELAAEDPSRIRVLRHPSGENRGLPASRNLGLSEAESSLVAFIDADDRWEPFKLAEQAALFRRDPELTMVCGPTLYRPIGEGEPSTLTPVLVDAPRRLGTGEFAAEMVRGNVTPPPPSNVMFRTTALRQAGGVPAGDSLYEDQRTFVAVSLIGPVLVSDRAWSSYTVRPDSLYGSLADDWVTRLRQQRDFHRWILRWAPRRGPAGRSLCALLVRRRLCGAVRRRVVDGADVARGLLSRRSWR